MLNRISVFTKHTLYKFGVTGICATLLHIMIVSALIEYKLLFVAEANSVGFVLATLFSYYINTNWSFDEKINSVNARRFVIVSLLGCGMTYLIASLIDSLEYHYLVGIATVVTLVPIYTYIMHSRWTYRDN